MADIDWIVRELLESKFASESALEVATIFCAVKTCSEIVLHWAATAPLIQLLSDFASLNFKSDELVCLEAITTAYDLIKLETEKCATREVNTVRNGSFGGKMAEERKPGKRGPKPKFNVAKGYQRGAPRLATRVDPDVLEWVESRPEGTRPYIERLVREDRERSQAGTNPDLADQQELAFEA